MKTRRSLSRMTRRSLGAWLMIAFTHVHAQDNWPLTFSAGTDQVQVFAPQPESIAGNTFTMRAAVAVQRQQDAQPLFGAVWGTGTLEMDRASRMGRLSAFIVTDARFSSITDASEVQRLRDMLSSELPKHSAPISMDWLASALESEQKADGEYKNDPPEIIYRDKPSMLVYVDGDPIYSPVAGAADAGGIERVTNTPYLLVRDGGEHYLYGSGVWFRSKALAGPWSPATQVPAPLTTLAQQVDSTASIGGKRADGPTVVPDIVVRTHPAILVDTDGPARMKTLPNSNLLYVSNSENDLFMDTRTQQYYLLASGRWFGTSDLNAGPWSYIPSDKLPAAFAAIPEGSNKDGVLAHVAGTTEARDAVHDAALPQTAIVDRTASLTVTYDGEPEFEPIIGTALYSAANASTNVLRISDRYHACDNGVWYDSSSPNGPWVVSTQVPAGVNDIPPSDPNYGLRYVYIYGTTPDVVYTGYTPGYLGCYVQDGVVIHGTGWYYHPWRTHWRPRPFTWGFNMYYDPWSGWDYGLGWGFDWYYPSWTYWGYPHGCGWGWWGPWHYEPAACGWHHGYYGPHPNGTGNRPLHAANPQNLYAMHKGNGVHPATIARKPSGAEQRPSAPAPHVNSKPMKLLVNDHFTDRQGDVYRSKKTNVERYDQGNWNRVTSLSNVPKEDPAATPERDGRPAHIQQDRSRGQQRATNMRQSRSGGESGGKRGGRR